MQDTARKVGTPVGPTPRSPRPWTYAGGSQAVAAAQPAAAAVATPTTLGGHIGALVAGLAPTGWEDLGLTLVAAAIIVAIAALLLRKVLLGVAPLEHELSHSLL